MVAISSTCKGCIVWRVDRCIRGRGRGGDKCIDVQGPVADAQLHGSIGGSADGAPVRLCGLCMYMAVLENRDRLDGMRS
jgi:hypothetical protein